MQIHLKKSVKPGLNVENQSSGKDALIDDVKVSSKECITPTLLDASFRAVLPTNFHSRSS